MTAIGSAWVELVFNDNWHWTNDDHTEARKGRWVVFYFKQASEWRLNHDDWPTVAPFCLAAERDTDCESHADNGADKALRNFLAWQAAQQPETPRIPEEPTGLGAVVEVGDDRFTRCDDGSDGMPWRRLRGGWMHWPSIIALGPVTVLSPGVNP